MGANVAYVPYQSLKPQQLAGLLMGHDGHRSAFLGFLSMTSFPGFVRVHGGSFQARKLETRN